MPTSTQPIEFEPATDGTPEVRTAIALEFIAARLSQMTYDLDVIRADLRAVATAFPTLINTVAQKK